MIQKRFPKMIMMIMIIMNQIQVVELLKEIKKIGQNVSLIIQKKNLIGFLNVLIM
jgi:hypothetical protein